MTKPHLKYQIQICSKNVYLLNLTNYRRAAHARTLSLVVAPIEKLRQMALMVWAVAAQPLNMVGPYRTEHLRFKCWE